MRGKFTRPPFFVFNPFCAYMTFCLYAVFSFFPGKVQAHKLSVDVYLRGKKVVVEAYYPLDGSPALGASVRVLDSNGRVVAQGNTDAAGVFSFLCEKKEDLVVEVEQAGHRATAKIRKEVLEGKTKEKKERAIKVSSSTSGHANRLAGVFAGLSLIFSLSAFLISLLTWKHLKRLRTSLDSARGS